MQTHTHTSRTLYRGEEKKKGSKVQTPRLLKWESKGKRGNLHVLQMLANHKEKKKKKKSGSRNCLLTTTSGDNLAPLSFPSELNMIIQANIYTVDRKEEGKVTISTAITFSRYFVVLFCSANKKLCAFSPNKEDGLPVQVRSDQLAWSSWLDPLNRRRRSTNAPRPMSSLN